MIGGEVFSLALKSILAHRLRSALTMLGIVIGVTSVILLVSLVSGLQTFITAQITSFGSNTIYIFPGKLGGGGPGGATVNRLTVKTAADLQRDLRGDAQISAAVVKYATLKAGNKSIKNTEVSGAEANFQEIVPAIKITDGRFFNASEDNAGKRVVVIGPTVAKELFPTGSALNRKIQVGNLEYTVIGITEKRGSVFGQDQDNSAIIPLSSATRQFGIDNINYILASANSADQVLNVQKKIQTSMEKTISEDDFTVQTSEQTLSTINQITGVLTMALGGIAAISLIVGGIGVMNIMLVSVTERTKEIGLRKAIGAKSADIRNQFLIEAVTLSGLGGIIGILLGYGLSLIVSIFFTTTVPLWSVLLSFGFSMAVGVLFGVIPAIRAAKLDPITALRYE